MPKPILRGGANPWPCQVMESHMDQKFSSMDFPSDTSVTIEASVLGQMLSI